jgi:hypothetical protein
MNPSSYLLKNRIIQTGCFGTEKGCHLPSLMKTSSLNSKVVARAASGLNIPEWILL